MASSYVTAIVVNWNLKEQTRQCFSSLEKLEFPCHTVIVDNGSSNGAARYLARHCPSAELIALPSNIGFGAACNRAIARALKDPTCEFILLLNNDATVDSDALTQLMIAAQDNPRAGIFGPKILYWDKPDTIWYAGARRRWGVLAAADTGRGSVDRDEFNELRDVDYVFGAAMLVRRDVFDRVGLFDERFFLYLEDLDFCLRAQRDGFSLMFVPRARVWHKVSSSTAHDHGIRNYHLAVSTLLFLKKHLSPALYLPSVVFWLLVLLRTIAHNLVLGKGPGIKPYWSGLIDGLTAKSDREQPTLIGDPHFLGNVERGGGTMGQSLSVGPSEARRRHSCRGSGFL